MPQKYRILADKLTVILMTMFMAPWSQHCHSQSSPGSFDKSSTSAGLPPTFGSGQSASASDLPRLAVIIPKMHDCHLLLLSPEADTHSAILSRIEG